MAATKKATAKDKAVKEAPVVETKPVIPETLPEVPQTAPSVEPDPIHEPEKAPEPIKVELPKIVQPIAEDISDEQKVENFLEKREGEIKMNDFLKSLSAVPRIGTPPDWILPERSKYIKNLLSKMQTEGKVNIVGDTHLRLGQFYHEGVEQKTKHHNLQTLEIVAKK